MRAVTRVNGSVVSIRRPDIDTDQIIPQNHLKRIERTGYGQYLFDSWAQNPDFVLNEPAREKAKVLITGANFGCGSSREHAVWAILDRGFEVVVATSFADIFSNNATNNGLLLIQLSDADVDRLHDIASEPTAKLDVSLETCQISFGEETWPFYIEPEVRRRLMEGLDMIDATLEHEHAIASFEALAQ